jgi:hypothetical protein
MTNFTSEWLAKKIEEIVDAPVSRHSVIASGVNETASRAYAREVRDHIDRARNSSSENANQPLTARG